MLLVGVDTDTIYVAIPIPGVVKKETTHQRNPKAPLVVLLLA